MLLKELFRQASSQISVIGTCPIATDVVENAQTFADLLTLNPNLSIEILCESDDELFRQSLCLDHRGSPTRLSYVVAKAQRDQILGLGSSDGLKSQIVELIGEPDLRQSAHSRIQIRQCNLRMPINLIVSDEKVYQSITTHLLPTADDYEEVTDLQNRNRLLEFADFYLNPSRGEKFLSFPGQELIQLYDRNNYPRGIFPRECFYTTSFKRYSIWGFVFNRNGELLLHRRSKATKDGRNLWDKSIGGHVDLRDSSTYITAQRELVEELFLPKAESSNYVGVDLGEFINFGDWNLTKRTERVLHHDFERIGKNDWAMFRATDDLGRPLIVDRTSQRRIHDKDGSITTVPTKFISDVYLFVAPTDLMDCEEAMKSLFEYVEKEGAGSDHRLVSLALLKDWIEDNEKLGEATSVFTDDLLHINTEYHDLLERFSLFVKSLSKNDS